MENEIYGKVRNEISLHLKTHRARSRGKDESGERIGERDGGRGEYWWGERDLKGSFGGGIWRGGVAVADAED